MDGSPGLRERKKVETRQALRLAAIALSRPSGPDAVSVEAICERAGVAKRTFFNYFAAKEDAVLGWSEDDRGHLEEAVAGRPAGEAALEALQAALATLVDEATASAVWHAQLELLRLHPELRGRLVGPARQLEETLAAGLARRTGRPRADPELVLLAAVAATTLRVTLAHWLDSPEGTDGSALLARAFAALREAHRPRSSMASS